MAPAVWSIPIAVGGIRRRKAKEGQAALSHKKGQTVVVSDLMIKNF